MEGTYRAVIITVSDSVAQGTREDISGPAVSGALEEAGWTVQSAETVPVAQGTREDISGPAVSGALEEAGWTVQSAETVPDDFNLLRERLEALAANIDVDVVFTTGGTGVGPREWRKSCAGRESRRLLWQPSPGVSSV
jgi:molybdopterin biosynthesis enzyme MoaB